MRWRGGGEVGEKEEKEKKSDKENVIRRMGRRQYVGSIMQHPVNLKNMRGTVVTKATQSIHTQTTVSLNSSQE